MARWNAARLRVLRCVESGVRAHDPGPGSHRRGLGAGQVKAARFCRGGTSHSDRMHLVERFRVDTDENVLIRDYTMEDPPFLATVVNGEDAMALSDAPYEPYGCVELSGDNNIR